jgi:hypothetical protein
MQARTDLGDRALTLIRNGLPPRGLISGDGRLHERASPGGRCSGGRGRATCLRRGCLTTAFVRPLSTCSKTSEGSLIVCSAINKSL